MRWEVFSPLHRKKKKKRREKENCSPACCIIKPIRFKQRAHVGGGSATDSEPKETFPDRFFFSPLLLKAAISVSLSFACCNNTRAHTLSPARLTVIIDQRHHGSIKRLPAQLATFSTPKKIQLHMRLLTCRLHLGPIYRPVQTIYLQVGKALSAVPSYDSLSIK